MGECYLGGAGGQKYAKGTVTFSAEMQTLSVTGLSFQPKRVTIQCSRNAAGYMGQNTISAYYDAVTGEFSQLRYDGGGVWNELTNIITINSDGFTATTSSSYKFPGSGVSFPIYWTAEAD